MSAGSCDAHSLKHTLGETQSERFYEPTRRYLEYTFNSQRNVTTLHRVMSGADE